MQKELIRSGFTIFGRKQITDWGFFEWDPHLPFLTSSSIDTADLTSPSSNDAAMTDKEYFPSPQIDLSHLTSARQITQYIQTTCDNGKALAPNLLIDPSTVSLPREFDYSNGVYHSNQFPYGETLAGALHVATQRMGGLQKQNIDLVCGGSFLEFLVHRPTLQKQIHDTQGRARRRQNPEPDQYYLTLLPPPPTQSFTDATHAQRNSNKPVIVIAKRKRYTKNWNSAGFQFERWVTEQPSTDELKARTAEKPSMLPAAALEHMQSMKVGPFHILFHTEVDACLPGDDTELVEISAMSNVREFGMLKAYQMIASGSPFLCHGYKNVRGTAVERIEMQTLSQLVKESINAMVAHHQHYHSNGTGRVFPPSPSPGRSERAILEGLKSIEYQVRTIWRQRQQEQPHDPTGPLVLPVYQLVWLERDELVLIPMGNHPAHAPSVSTTHPTNESEEAPTDASSQSQATVQHHMPLPPTDVVAELMGYPLPE